MNVVKCDNYDEMSLCAANEIADVVRKKPNAVLGLATGSTPVGMYDILSQMYSDGKLDFSQITSINLDEYYPISPDNRQSYRYFMNQNLFSRVNIDLSRTHVPSGIAEDIETECREYDKLIDTLGGIDIQVLGIGRNGHIGFNEPGEELYVGTHVTQLTQSTIDANSRFFSEDEIIPDRALTMGIGSIFKARKIIILASGESKREAVSYLLSEKISTECPASLLNLHENVTLICDNDALR